jgi:hypothetical protein
MNHYRVKVFIPDDMGCGTTTYFGRHAESAQEAMESVAEDNPDIEVIQAILS